MTAMLNRTQLPDNIDALKALLSAKSAQIDAFEQERAAWKVESEALRHYKQGAQQEIERLTPQLDRLRRALFVQQAGDFDSKHDNGTTSTRQRGAPSVANTMRNRYL